MTRPPFVHAVVTAASVVAIGVGFAGAQTSRPGAASTPAAAATPLADSRWAPWIGCWRSVDDPGGAGARLCVTPTDTGIATATIVGSQRVTGDQRIADGREHAITEGDCRGTESATWSTRAQRLYRRAAVTCGNDAPRTRATVSFFLPGPTWVDVETVTTPDAETSVRVARFVRAYDQKLPDGTVVAPVVTKAPSQLPRDTKWTVEDVLELTAALPADGVQAAIAEAPAPFHLDAKALTRLADAGVGERVIDLMIGVTYPQKFAVDRLAAGGGSGYSGMGSGLGYDPFFAPLMGPSVLMDCYSPFGWARSSYWNSCAGYSSYLYGAYGAYPYGYYDPWNTGWINVPSLPGNGGGSPTPAGEGRVVNGRGYTQVRPIDTIPAVGGSNGSWSGASSSGNSGSSSSGSSGVSSSGYSGGGASSSGGGGDRTAVPRPPGQ